MRSRLVAVLNRKADDEREAPRSRAHRLSARPRSTAVIHEEAETCVAARLTIPTSLAVVAKILIRSKQVFIERCASESRSVKCSDTISVQPDEHLVG